MLKNYLVNYPNKSIANKLLSGFSVGFRLHYSGPRIHIESSNLISAHQHPRETMEKIADEIKLGRIGGPYEKLPISNLRVSPIGIVPKGDNAGWRLITHLSFPTGNSINEFIDPAESTVHYSSFDSVVQMLAKVGKGASIAKMDIKSAFRLLPINAGDFDLLGIKFEGKYYIDKCLPMGCSVSCKVFEEFATFLQWVVEQKTSLSTIDHYLDDFIFAGKDFDTCSKLMETFKKVAKELGVPLAEDKSVGPTNNLVFLGLEIDTVAMMVRVPVQKRVELVSLLQKFIARRSITLKQLQSLLGKLNFVTKAIAPGRAFVRRMHNATIGIINPHHFIRLNQEMKDDMQLWLKYLQDFNGKVYFSEAEWSSNLILDLFTDSAGAQDLGCGAYFQGEWCYFSWPAGWEKTNILADMTTLELIPVVLALCLWGARLANKKVLFHIDNQALVTILNKQTSKSQRVMFLLRPFIIDCMLHNICFRAVHIPTKNNIIADSISRQQWQRFRQAAPQAQIKPVPVPNSFQHRIYNMR